MTATLDYLYKNEGAFSQGQLARLADARVAVGGLGAYGHGAVALAQLGVATGPRGLLRIADPDVFERHNANRQAQATLSNRGRNKTDVIAAHIRDLVPEARLDSFREGVTLDNLDAFLDGVDIVVDAVDFLRPEVKLELHRRARMRGIPIVMGLLVNKGAVCYFFDPSGPSFEEFFAYPADPALRASWVMPGSRIIPHRTTFPNGASPERSAQLHTFEVLTGQRHIASNPIAAAAVQMTMNWLTTSALLGEPVPAIPEMVYLDPTTLAMGTVDLSPAIDEQRSSIWTRIAPVYDQVLQCMPVYTDVMLRMGRDLEGCARVLEGGVGTGLIADHLARRGMEVSGIDLNLAMLAHALRRAAGLRREGTGRMHVGEGNVESLYFEDGSFDGYCSNNVVFDADIRAAMREAWRVLKPGGVLAINSCRTVPDLEALGGVVDRMAGLGVRPEAAAEFLRCQVEMYEGRALRGGLRTHDTTDVVGLLREIGFREVARTETSYAGANFYVVARK